MGKSGISPMDYMDEHTVLITPTGSRLYGLSTPESDLDLLVLSTRGETSVQSTSALDLRRVTIDSFLDRIRDKPGGVYLEALYSKLQIQGPAYERYGAVLQGFVPELSFLRGTMAKIGQAALAKPLYKRVRLAAYMGSRWSQWYWSGQQYFDPTLNAAERSAVEDVAQRFWALSDLQDREKLFTELFFPDFERAKELYALELNPRAASSGNRYSQR